TESSSPESIGAKIDLNHLRVACHVGGLSLRDQLAVVEHHAAVHHAHQHAHDVLDPDDGDAALLADRGEHVGGLVHLCVIDAAAPAISRPRKRTDPAVGRSAPAMRLKMVLLPEPFGPMRPRSSPSATSNETLLTARKPSKLFVRPETSSTTARRRDPSGRAAP